MNFLITYGTYGIYVFGLLILTSVSIVILGVLLQAFQGMGDD